jgi:hypothetical protein
VSPVKYELGFYIPEEGILHSHRRENLKSYIALTGLALQRRRNVSPVKYELGFYIPEEGILRSHRRENLSLTHTSGVSSPDIPSEPQASVSDVLRATYAGNDPLLRG